MENLILMSDSYKYSHKLQYPSGVSYMHSYLESRGSDGTVFDKPYVKFFGLQYYIKRYLSIRVTKEMVDEAQDIIQRHGLYFDYDGWMQVVIKHGGILPLRIRAVKEGSIIEKRNVLLTIESTDPELFWLVGWAETLLMKVWYPTTVATLSHSIYTQIREFMLSNCDNLEKLPFMLHDFGYRGASSEETAGIGGMAHLTNFLGTDNVAALVYARKYYHSDIAGYSIPASEHSTITSWGQEKNDEYLAFKNMIEKFGGDYPLIACVSDSFDFSKAIDIWGSLNTEIIDSGSTIVIRPDSGDAKSNILLALKKLEGYFGTTKNSKGYKVLNNVALIQGDGVDTNLIYDILTMMDDHGYSADNIAFGMGGALLQGNLASSVNRDTHKFAIKCSSILKDGVFQDVFKNPITDTGKKSKKGRLDLIKNSNGEYKTIILDDTYQLGNYHENSELITYYDNGIVVDYIKLEDTKCE